MSLRLTWIVWGLLSLIASGYFVRAVIVDDAASRRSLLPGETTHGHYQIELDCQACHTSFLGVKQDACERCHAQDLDRHNDTHPASKFNDPTNADRLAKIDAQKCVTCHREHVPERTHAMGLAIPTDYCYYCHQDVASERPSHSGMSHDSCATAGCHNYHDNRALYENFLFEHRDDPDVLDQARVPLRNLSDTWRRQHEQDRKPLGTADSIAPPDRLIPTIVEHWSSTSHAAAGVNCRDCHAALAQKESLSESHRVEWHDSVEPETCAHCHAAELTTFLQGRHGMRIAQGMSPMKPTMARLSMREEMAHSTLDCSACHRPHEYDTRYAAVEACIQCHADKHTESYRNSLHYQLWQREVRDEAEPGTGVSCATCHLPRIEIDGRIQVNHNQNDNLRPNEKMVRSVCIQCHGLDFSLRSLADTELIQRCFTGQPNVQVDSVGMATRWFEEKLKRGKLKLNAN